MSKSVKLFGRKVSVFLIALVVIGFGAAATIPFWGQIFGIATVSQGLVLDGGSWDVPITDSLTGITSLEASTQLKGHVLENQAVSAPAIFGLSWTCSPTNAPDCVGIGVGFEYPLNATGPVAGTEDRVVVAGGALGTNLTTINDLNSISWNVTSGVGYAPHVDVFLSNGEVLVFEYAKVDPLDCDNVTNYPTGDFNTFKDKGVISGSSKAWLSSGPAGPCGDPTFEAGYKTLDEWKTNFSGVGVNRFEFEVDNWIVDSSATLSGIRINGLPVEGSYLASNQTLDFNIRYKFAQMLMPDTYNITTTVGAFG